MLGRTHLCRRVTRLWTHQAQLDPAIEHPCRGDPWASRQETRPCFLDTRPCLLATQPCPRIPDRVCMKQDRVSRTHDRVCRFHDRVSNGHDRDCSRQDRVCSGQARVCAATTVLPEDMVVFAQDMTLAAENIIVFARDRIVLVREVTVFVGEITVFVGEITVFVADMVVKARGTAVAMRLPRVPGGDSTRPRRAHTIQAQATARRKRTRPGTTALEGWEGHGRAAGRNASIIRTPVSQAETEKRSRRIFSGQRPLRRRHVNGCNKHSPEHGPLLTVGRWAALAFPNRSRQSVADDPGCLMVPTRSQCVLPCSNMREEWPCTCPSSTAASFEA